MRTENPLDANLLKVLCALLGERSVTRAATRLNLSQPATSLQLKRLRAIFGDPLLVRAKGGMALTERAEALLGPAIRALEEIDNLLVDTPIFDPLACRRTFTVALPDHILPMMFGAILREFRRQAPHARLEMRALSPDYNFEGALAAGTADIVISNWPAPPPYLRRTVLFEDHFVCLVDQEHEFTRRPPSVEAYLAANHIAPSHYSIAHRGVVETHLSSLRLERERRIIVSYFSMAPYLLVGTDLVFTATRHFAEYYAGILPLAIIDSPIAYPQIQFYQLWHERMQQSPSHRWLRQLFASMRHG